VRLHPTTTDDTHARALKKSFDEKTKPATLKRLEDLKKWLSPIAGESSTSTIVTGNLTVKNSNDEEK
jgi:hypothetical protein